MSPGDLLIAGALLFAFCLGYALGRRRPSDGHPHRRRMDATVHAATPTVSAGDADRIRRVYDNALRITVAAYNGRPLTREAWTTAGGSEREWTNAVKFCRAAGVIRGPAHMPLWETLDDAKFALRRYQRRLRELAAQGEYVPPW